MKNAKTENTIVLRNSSWDYSKFGAEDINECLIEFLYINNNLYNSGNYKNSLSIICLAENIVLNGTELFEYPTLHPTGTHFQSVTPLKFLDIVLDGKSDQYSTQYKRVQPKLFQENDSEIKLIDSMLLSESSPDLFNKNIFMIRSKLLKDSSIKSVEFHIENDDNFSRFYSAVWHKNKKLSTAILSVANNKYKFCDYKELKSEDLIRISTYEKSKRQKELMKLNKRFLNINTRI